MAKKIKYSPEGDDAVELAKAILSGVTRSIERIREIPEYSGTYVFPVISWKNR